MYLTNMKTSSGIEFVRNLLKRGAYTFTRADAAKELAQTGPNLNAKLRHLVKSGWVMPISEDFLVIIDPQHQAYGTLPPEWFIDELARYKGFEYYVGGLSAAMIHGASHQKYHVFQVMSNRQFRNISRTSLKMRFLYKKNIADGLYQKMKVPTGYFRVSTPEVTAYDLLLYRRTIGSLNSIATILVELGEAMRARNLAALLELGCELSILQRLGFLLDETGWESKTSCLSSALNSARTFWEPLDPRMPSNGDRNRKWKIIVNTEIEADIQKEGEGK